MIEVRHLTQVPVGMLRPGLYIAQLDRPWSEVPVKFQGFELHSDYELKVLKKYCEFVYVESERSREDAYAALEADIADPQTEGKAKPGQTDISAVFGSVRQPEKHAFEKRVQMAAESRTKALRYLERMLEEARLGRAVNTHQARALVEEMAAQVSGNTSAVMWLTNLRSKDEYASMHSLNVCVLTLAFGMYLGLRGQELYAIAMGALLHDIGKIKQPPELLSKTTPLNVKDWEWIRRHPDDGCDIASESRELPSEALDIIRMHHERIDGQGFPRGLKGEEIPRHARIVALVNLYDSLTASRPYRPGRPADEVLQDLYNGRRNTFGAELVEAFIHCIGIFPIGSLVELNNGALGIVLGSSPDNRLKPTVLMVRTPDGRDFEKRLLVNLAAEPDAEEGPTAEHIRRVVNPRNYGIDVSAIVAFEFGIDW